MKYNEERKSYHERMYGMQYDSMGLGNKPHKGKKQVSDSMGVSKKTSRKSETKYHETSDYGSDKEYRHKSTAESDVEEHEINSMIVSQASIADNLENLSTEVVAQKTMEQSEKESTSKKKKQWSPQEIAEYLNMTGNFRKENDSLMIYNEEFGYWEATPATNDNRRLRRAIPKEFRASINTHALVEVYEWLVLDAEDFQDNPESRNYINLADVAVNWHNNAITTERKQLCFRYYLKAEETDLNSDGNGRFKSFLDTVFGDDKKTRKEFKKFLGITLAGIRDQKVIFIMHGASNTGKTVLLNAISKIFGNNLVSSLSFSQLNHEFAITHLVGKSVNLTGELSGVSSKRLDIVKSLSGNDHISLGFKHKEQIDAFPRCLLIFASNVFPAIHDVRELSIFLNRVIIYPFENIIPRSKWISNLGDLLAEDVSNILRYAIKGLQEWEADSYQFIESEAMLAKKKEFRCEFDSFSLFAEEHLEGCLDTKVTSREIYRQYMSFCNCEGLIPLAANQWPVVMKQLFKVKEIILEVYDPQQQKKVRRRGYQGIRLVSQEEGNYIADQIYPDKRGGTRSYDD